MITIRKTVDIPADRKGQFDAALPETVPVGCGPAQAAAYAVLKFPSVARGAGVSKPETPGKLSPDMEKAMKEAREKRSYQQSHPKELREALKKLQEGPPLFGGIGADQFKRVCGDEWDQRF